MRVDEVRSGGFGPLPPGAALTLAPGLTVVWGPNEAGKSSWHAALFAGLCGQRRGPGRTAEQRELEEAHRPWRGGPWRAETTVTLADGRVLELCHDLDSPDRSRVVDRDTGDNLTGDLVSDGGPDGARLLGLTRRTLPHTAMVRQADVRACTDAPDELRRQLQRAAAAGDAATAEEAIQRLERVRAEAVGSEQAPTRPLARALSALADAEAALGAARADHAELMRLAAEHREAAVAEQEAEVELARLDTEQARREVDRLADRLAAAEQLAERLPGWLVAEVEAARGTDDGAAAAGPPAALEPGDGAAEAGGGAGDAAGAAEPGGDAEPHPDVERAAERRREAEAALRWHDRREPERSAAPAEADPAELREAAAALAAEPAGVDAGVAERVRALQAEQRRRRTRRVATGMAAAAGAGLAGLALAAGRAGLAALAALATAALAVAAVVAGRFAGEADLAEARAELAAQRRDAARDAQRRRQAEERAAELGVPAKPERLHELARGIERARELEREHAAWAAERAELAADLADAEAALADALERRGQRRGAHADLDAVLAAYRRGCRERADRAQETARRDAAQLATLLGAHTLEGLRAAAAARRETLEAHRAALPEGGADLAALAGLADDALEARRAEQREHLERARRHEAEVVGRLRRQEETARSVAEAEEARARRADEVARLRSLGAVLDVARDHLRAAVERVGRDLAPVLRSAVERRLPALTEGRYRRAAVDPATLEVTVDTPEGGWQPAGRLSHGAGEQVYVLLRIALAEHLGGAGEPPPLLLDEVVAHADEERTARLLELLLELAGERQVVLFTQERAVREWAQRRLDEPPHRLVVLDPATTESAAGDQPT